MSSTENLDALQATSLGARLSALRRALGIRTTQDLASAIANPRITSAVIRNIESGRKPDVSVAQLLDLASGLGVSPLLLLVPVGLPLHKVEWPNVGADVAGMTTLDILRWFRGDVDTRQPSTQLLNVIAHTAINALLRVQEDLAWVDDAQRALDITRASPESAPDPYNEARLDRAMASLRETLDVLEGFDIDTQGLTAAKHSGDQDG